MFCQIMVLQHQYRSWSYNKCKDDKQIDGSQLSISIAAAGKKKKKSY